MDDDLDRYQSKAVWEQPDPYKKQREQARRELNLAPDPADSMLQTRPAGEWITRGRKHRVSSSELFGSLWREGEVAVLFGDKGSGKSVLAVQIAEDIAQGRNTASRECASSPTQKPTKVLYLDFQLTARQFSERYSSPSPIPGKLPVKCRFRFTRAQIEWDGRLPAAFKNDLNGYLQHSIFHQVEASGARVLIVDDISYLARDAGSIRVMKTLKLQAATYGLSILVIAHMKGRRTKSAPITLSDIAGSRHIAELADSVFAIGRSTFGPEYRYVKHLASPAAVTHDASNLLTYQLERTWSADSTDTSASENPSLTTHRTPLPFLGLTFLGPSTESDHLRDYAAETRRAEDRERRSQLPARSNPKNVTNMLLSRDYQRYLDR